MNEGITVQLFIAIGSLLFGVLSYILERFVFKPRLRRLKEAVGLPNFGEKMRQLSEDHSRASAEVDKTLEEMTMVSQAREGALKSLEGKLDELSKYEKELKARVETLKSIPLPAVEYFLQVTGKGERRSAARDYILFAAGVVVSTIIAIILKLVFNI